MSTILDEVLQGDAIGFAEAGRLIPGSRGKPSTNPATVFRWATVGVRLPDGSRLRLESARIAGRHITSKASLRRFLERQNTDHDPTQETTRRQVQVDHAIASCKAAGL